MTRRWQVLPEGVTLDAPHLDLWREVSAEELLTGVEEGLHSLDTVARAGERATPKPLRKLLRELVWSARADAERVLLGERQSAYLDLVDRAPVPAAISDLGGRLTYVNEALCEFLDYPREELIGMTVGALSHPDDHARESQEARGLIEGRLKNFRMEKRYVSKGGEERVGALSLVLLHTAEGAPYAALALIADLTPLKRLQETATRARTLSALAELGQRVTHDLKNILMVLRGTLDLLNDRASTLDLDDHELIMSGLQMCQSGEALVRSLLDLGAEPSAPIGPVHLADLLRALSPTLARAVAPAALRVEVLCPEEGSCALGEPQLLERALLNLCVNARHAIEEARASLPPREHSVTLRLREGSAQERARWGVELIILEVCDTGVGIPSHLLSKVLEPYMSTRKGRGGHGLGLATVQAVCAQIGGALDLESVEGEGATFRLLLPRSACAAGRLL